jgi:hypothetical protein
MKTIADRWTEFGARVLPQNAHATQRQEMRRSFYAGFFEALVACSEMADESGDNDDVGATMMHSLHDECLRFAQDVDAGRA